MTTLLLLTLLTELDSIMMELRPTTLVLMC